MSQNSKVGYSFQLDRLLRVVASICLYAGMALIFAMTLLVVVHVFGRYVFREPVPGQVELCVYLMTSAVFLMAGYTQLEKGHVIIDVVIGRFSKRTQAICDSVAYVMYLGVAILVCWQSVVFGNYIMHSGQISTILQIPQFPVYYIVAFGWGLFSLAILMDLVHFLHTAVKE